MAIERKATVQVRQGDVLLTPMTLTGDVIENIVRNGRKLLQPDGCAILATGLGGGHPHRVIGDVNFVEANNKQLLRQQPDDQVSRLLVIGDGGAVLTHDEHDEIELPPNSAYVVFRQLETLVGDDNNPSAHLATGILANDRTPRVNAPSRRYVED